MTIETAVDYGRRILTWLARQSMRQWEWNYEVQSHSHDPIEFAAVVAAMGRLLHDRLVEVDRSGREAVYKITDAGRAKIAPPSITGPSGASYTHVGGRAYIGHYAVTADAHRTPGRVHALNAIKGNRSYKALCGVIVGEGTDDHFYEGNPIRPIQGTGADQGVTCRRCNKALGRE